MWRSRGRSPAESEQKYTVVPTVQRLPSAGDPCVCSQSPDSLRVTGLHRTCAGLCARDSDRIVDSLPLQGTIYPSNIVHRLRRTFSVTRCCSQRPCDVCFHSFPELSGPRALSRSARASPPHSPSWSWRRWCSGDGGVLGVVARGGRLRARSIYFCGPVLRAFWLAGWLACAPCSLREMGKAGVAIWRVPRRVVVVVFLKGAALVPSVGFCGLEKNQLCVETGAAKSMSRVTHPPFVSC